MQPQNANFGGRLSFVLTFVLNRFWLALILAIVDGALIPFSFAPYNIWPIAIASVSLFFLLLDHYNSAKSALWLSWCFGLGMFGAGVYWIYVSIYVYGNTPFGLALVLVALFVIGVAFLFALPFALYGRRLKNHRYSILLALPALWIISEWFRSWIFTGFPWLYLGYAHIDTWLAGWAPVTGVMGISFILSFCSAVILFLFKHKPKPFVIIALGGVCVALWVAGFLLKNIEWTEAIGEPIKVGMAQGNIPQEKKNDAAYYYEQVDRYLQLTEELWEHENNWVIWPEAAVPFIMHHPYHDEEVNYLFDYLRERSIKSNSGLVLGIRYYDTKEDKYYNAILGLGLGAGIYFKQHLVPIGEHMPLEKYLRGTLALFNLPSSIIDVGPMNEHGIQIGEALISPTICYEIVFPDAVARQARNGHILVNISNDAWFGKSIGPLQHMQIAQMRAQETGRELIRSTNNGVSAFVDHRGHIKSKTEQFVAQTLEGEVQRRSGLTPFMIWESEPVIFFAMLLWAISAVLALRQKRG